MGVEFELKGYSVTEHRAPGSSSGRGLEFEKDGAAFYYTGSVGNLPHDEKCYKDIAKQIMKQVGIDGDGQVVWPDQVDVTVQRGAKEVDEPWTKRDDREDFLHGGHF